MTLYHYCNANTFFNIVKDRTIWLSSLTASNDALEGKWLARAFDAKILEAGINPFYREELNNILRTIEYNFDSLGFCMSQEPDILSQWRGYSDDGLGFCIGFSQNLIESLVPDSGDLYHQKITYDFEAQKNLLSPGFDEIKAIAPVEPLGLASMVARAPVDKAANEARRRKLFLIMRDHILPLQFSLKNPAFAEEKEERIVTPVVKPLNNLDFRVAGNRIVPYREVRFPLNVTDPIVEVWMGPKNLTPKDVVEGFLGRSEITAGVYRSNASYR